MRISVGICAHNEEKNILNCLRAVSSQELYLFELSEIIVVSSASTDRTDDLVRSYARIDPRVRLLLQDRREGKSSAVNLFMKCATGEILVLVNADNILKEGSLQKLLEPFLDDNVGMVGGHPVPVNLKENFVGFSVHMLWDLHHRLSLIVPKTGEFIAFRNLGLRIPDGVNTDEDWIRMEVEKRGLRVVYAPDAIVMNKGPMNITDLWKQRTRVNIGERYMKKRFNFCVPTWELKFLMAALKDFLRDNSNQLHRIFGFMIFEVLARLYASIHVTVGRADPYIWDIVESTKELK